MFKPNEYFEKVYVKNYNEELKKQGKPEVEAWVVYMETIRAIMANVLGYKLSEHGLEDKFAYKALLKKKKAKKE